jgi:hypothetical protein
MPAAEGLALLGLSFFLIRAAMRCDEFRRSAGALHPVIWALAAAVILRYASHFSNLVHLIKYRDDGVGLRFFNVVAEVLFTMSQAIHITLLIAIARGYTLLPSRKEDSKPEFPGLTLVASLAAHAGLVCFDKLQEATSPHRHHENDGIAGWTMIFIRLALFIAFVRAAQATRECGGLMLKDFMQKFQLAGSLYFLAYPLVFLLAQVFAPYLRHPIIVVGLLVTQAKADMWLADLFLERGAYFKVSSLNASLLPGAGFGLDKGC